MTRGGKVPTGERRGLAREDVEGSDVFDFIVDEAYLDLSATTKEGVIRELVGGLVKHGVLTKGDMEAIVQSVLERERRGTTGIGNGLAVPHSKNCGQVDRLVGIFGRSVSGVGFGAVDGEPAFLFFLLCAPPDHPTAQTLNLKVLKRISAIGQDNNFCRYLREAKRPAEIRDLLDEAAKR